MKNNKPITFKEVKKNQNQKRSDIKNTKEIQSKKYVDKATEKKADGGRIGRKLGGGADMAKRKTNVQKIKETFAPKNWKCSK